MNFSSVLFFREIPMANLKRTYTALTLILLFNLPNQVTADETEPGKLIASLNSNAAKIELEMKRVNKEINSYSFSKDKKMLLVNFDEEIRVFINDQHAATHHVTGRISIVPEQIDLNKLEFDGNNYLINIICQDLKNCMNREEQVTRYGAGDVEIDTKSRNYPTHMFQLQGVKQSLADQLIKDMKALFPMLTPQTKTIGKP